MGAISADSMRVKVKRPGRQMPHTWFQLCVHRGLPTNTEEMSIPQYRMIDDAHAKLARSDALSAQ